MAAESAAAPVGARGRLRGLGFGSYLEVTAPPSKEMGGLRFEPDGTVTEGAGQLRMALVTGEAEPVAVGIPELDRVLGGGLVPGSVTLVGGEPGIGKSTLLLQALASLATSGATCLYVSAEESTRQVALRAERLGVYFWNLVWSLDRRVLTKQYGRLFLESLPQCTARQGPASNLPREAGKWLGM